MTASPDPAATAPGLGRRLAAMLYEGLLLLGVLFPTVFLFSALTDQRHALVGRSPLQLVLFLALAAYFVWFWTHGGQTLAMKTWRLRVLRADGQPLTQGRALARYLLAWLWFLPALLTLHLSGLKGGGATAGVLLAGVLAYAAASRLHPQRQFLHDALCGTRIVDAPPPPRPA